MVWGDRMVAIGRGGSTNLPQRAIDHAGFIVRSGGKFRLDFDISALNRIHHSRLRDWLRDRFRQGRQQSVSDQLVINTATHRQSIRDHKKAAD